MTRALMLGLALLLAAFALPAAADRTIDDFEHGAFSFDAGAATQNQTQLGLPPTSTIGGQRTVIIQALAGGELVSAELVLTPGDDGVSLSSDLSGGDFTISYGDFGMPTLDLTDGGTADRIEVVVSQAAPSGVLKLALSDDLGGGDSPSQPLAGPGTYVFPFAALASADPSRIQILQVDLNTTSAGTIVVDHVRAASPMPVPGLSLSGGVVLIALILAGALVSARRRVAPIRLDVGT